MPYRGSNPLPCNSIWPAKYDTAFQALWGQRGRCHCSFLGEVKLDLLWGLNAGKNPGSGLLNETKRFGERSFVTRIKLDVIGARSVQVQADGGTDHECDRLGFRLAD